MWSRLMFFDGRAVSGLGSCIFDGRAVSGLGSCIFDVANQVLRLMRFYFSNRVLR